MKQEVLKVSQSSVAQALASDYFSIYVVDPDTDHFIEYSSSGNYDQLGIEKSGDDFFGLSRLNMARVIYPEDKDRFLGTFTKEKIMSSSEPSSLAYRPAPSTVPPASPTVSRSYRSRTSFRISRR